MDRFKVHRRLGGGGGGEVYYCCDLKRGRAVALKVASTPLTQEGTYLQQLQQHSHVPQCYAYGYDPHARMYYLAMQYIRARTLHQVLQDTQDTNEGDESSIDWHQIAIQLMTVLADVHACHLIFRDLKPSNVLITDTGWLYLIDFGLTCPAFASSYGNPRAGTRGYLPPEVLQQGLVTPSMDVYALGRIFQDIARKMSPLSKSSLYALSDHCLAPMAKRPDTGAAVLQLYQHFVQRRVLIHSYSIPRRA